MTLWRVLEKEDILSVSTRDKNIIFSKFQFFRFSMTLWRVLEKEDISSVSTCVMRT